MLIKNLLAYLEVLCSQKVQIIKFMIFSIFCLEFNKVFGHKSGHSILIRSIVRKLKTYLNLVRAQGEPITKTDYRKISRLSKQKYRFKWETLIASKIKLSKVINCKLSQKKSRVQPHSVGVKAIIIKNFSLSFDAKVRVLTKVRLLEVEIDGDCVCAEPGIDNLNYLSLVNSQAPEFYRGPRVRCARSGENGEGEVRLLWVILLFTSNPDFECY